MSHSAPTRCDRCGTDFASAARTMSFFNTDEICTACSLDERDAPNYARAHAAECDAVRRGNTNFPGIGLAPEDEAFLAARRRARTRSP